MARAGAFVVLSRPKSPAEDAEFNRWYDEHHVPSALLLPGFGRARRFRLADEQLLPQRAIDPTFRYVTIFEIDDVDRVPEARALLPRLMRMSVQFFSDALDRDTMRAFVVEQVADINEPAPLPDGVTSLAELPEPGVS